jgi:UDP-glucose 4-epimerase
VLVTGGCGYIGARLVPFLLADGHKVNVQDPMWFGHGYLPKDNKSLKINHPIDDDEAVIYLGGLTNNDACVKHPEKHEAANINAPLGMLMLPTWKRFIFASSVAAYGNVQHATENLALNPTTPYGEAKKLVEQRVLAANGTVVRAASVCGPSSNMRFDTPINRMTREAMIHGEITVNGGSQVRCHVGIDDLCEFYRMLLKAEGISGEAFNVVDSCETILATAERVRSVTGAKINLNPSSDSRSYSVSGQKAKNWFGWKPRKGLDEAIGLMHRTPQFEEFTDLRMRMM